MDSSSHSSGGSTSEESLDADGPSERGRGSSKGSREPVEESSEEVEDDDDADDDDDGDQSSGASGSEVQ